MSSNTCLIVDSATGALMRRTITDTPNPSLTTAEKSFVSDWQKSSGEEGVWFRNWIPDVVIGLTPATAYFVRRLRAIRFNASWDLVMSGERTPIFLFSGQYNDWKKPQIFDWRPPQDMLVLFIMGVTNTHPNSVASWWDKTPAEHYTGARSYGMLVASKSEPPRDTKFYRPPFPNLYENLALCTGSMSYPQNFNSLTWIEQFDCAVSAWSANRWNRDLLPDSAKLNRLMAFDAKGNQLPSLDWERQMVNEYTLNNLPYHKPVATYLKANVWLGE